MVEEFANKISLKMSKKYDDVRTCCSELLVGDELASAKVSIV